MLDSRPPLPLRFRLWNKVAHYLRADRLRFASLAEKHLHRAAMKETGLTDFGDPYYREGLLTLIESAGKDANLHVLGRAIMHGTIVVFLSNRLLLAEARRQTPEVFQRPVIPPIIIVGLPRSGTTLLHRMLALDPAHRGAPSWELACPLPSGTPDRRRELAYKGDRFMQQLHPGRDRIHYSRIDVPRMAEMWISLMEKQAATGLTFRGTNPGVIHDVYYDRFVADPIRTVRGLYDHFGLTWPDRHEEKLEAYVRENPQNKHGVHRYSPEDFGLTNDAIAGRFTQYRRRFGFAD